MRAEGNVERSRAAPPCTRRCLARCREAAAARFVASADVAWPAARSAALWAFCRLYFGPRIYFGLNMRQALRAAAKLPPHVKMGRRATSSKRHPAGQRLTKFTLALTNFWPWIGNFKKFCLTGDARPLFFTRHYALLEEQVRRVRSDDGRL